MAVALNPRAERLLARVRRVTVYSALELLLLVLIAVQCARLFWSFLTPIGPVGDYKALDLMRPVPAAAPTMGSFDPFFRQAPGAPVAQAPAVVTALDIRLFGITANRATGGGSAIIGTVNGQQRSYQVGEEIMPGVVLSGVGFDYVTISRAGTPEQLYIDQSPAAPGPNSPGGQGSPPPMVQPPMVVPTVRVPQVAPPPPPPPPPPPGSINMQPSRPNQ
jgi:general secretion pathway protein C